MTSEFENIEEQFRRAILESGMTRYRLCKLSGVTNSQLSLFVHGKRSLTLGSAAKVAQVLGIELIQKKKKAQKAKRR
jgi:transcriptional regulator with XRE-family HTH domain